MSAHPPTRRHMPAHLPAPRQLSAPSCQQVAAKGGGIAPPPVAPLPLVAPAPDPKHDRVRDWIDTHGDLSPARAAHARAELAQSRNDANSESGQSEAGRYQRPHRPHQLRGLSPVFSLSGGGFGNRCSTNAGLAACQSGATTPRRCRSARSHRPHQRTLNKSSWTASIWRAGPDPEFDP